MLTKSKIQPTCIQETYRGEKNWIHLLILEEREIITKLKMFWKLSYKTELIQSTSKQLTDLSALHLFWIKSLRKLLENLKFQKTFKFLESSPRFSFEKMYSYWCAETRHPETI